jgi:hypothetical protein
MQHIAPQLSKDEYEKQIAEEAALTQCRTAVKRVRSLYRSIAGIDYAEDQVLESIETQITNTNTNTKANLTHLINQRKELEEQAAQLDIAGKQISIAC